MIVNTHIYGVNKASSTFTFTVSGLFQYPAKVTVPNTVTSMTASTASMQQHNEIEEIEFESGSSSSFRYLPAQCFYNCRGLEKITLPDSVTTLQGSTFSGCNVLETVVFANGQKVTFSNNEFSSCYALSQASYENIIAHMADTQTSIGAGLFMSCRELENIILPQRITSVNSNAFNGCTSLVSAELPAVTTVGAGVFSGCTSLRTLKYGAVLGSASTAYINHASSSNVVYGCTSLEDVQIPEGWTENMRLSFTDNLTHDSMIAMIANLYDHSGGTAHTLTLGAANLARLSAEEIAVAAAKNWTLA